MLSEIFQFDFMVRAFVVGAAVAVMAPLIGGFLVARRYSMMADTLAHTALAGAATGVFLGLPPFWGALAAALLAGVLMERARSGGKIFGDALLAIFLSGSLALAAVLAGAARGFNAGLFNLLFGSVAAVRPGDLWLLLVFGAVSTAVILLSFKELFLVSFDEELAEAAGIRARAFNMALAALAAVTVTLAIQIVGALLVGALAVIPFISAMRFRRGFNATILIAIALALASVFGGLFLAYYLGWASGGAIVLVSLSLLLLSLMF